MIHINWKKTSVISLIARKPMIHQDRSYLLPLMFICEVHRCVSSIIFGGSLPHILWLVCWNIVELKNQLQNITLTSFYSSKYSVSLWLRLIERRVTLADYVLYNLIPPHKWCPVEDLECYLMVLFLCVLCRVKLKPNRESYLILWIDLILISALGTGQNLALWENQLSRLISSFGRQCFIA